MAGSRMAPVAGQSVAKRFEGGTLVMSTLAVVEEILRETGSPMSVREIVERAGVRLPSKSKTPDTVVARDLSMDLKRKGETSLFTRASPGRYTLRALAPVAQPAPQEAALEPSPIAVAQSPISIGIGARKPAAASPSTQSASTAATLKSDVHGGGFAG